MGLRDASAVLGSLLPTAAYRGAVHLPEDARPVSAAVRTRPGVLTVGQIFGVGRQREACRGL